MSGSPKAPWQWALVLAGAAVVLGVGGYLGLGPRPLSSSHALPAPTPGTWCPWSTG